MLNNIFESAEYIRKSDLPIDFSIDKINYS